MPKPVSIKLVIPQCLVIALFLAVSGCATLSKTECLKAEWREIGFEDAANGYPVTRISEHRKACSKHDVAPDLDLYRAGHAVGLREFCRYANGVKRGLDGYQYEGICPAELEADFLAGYRKGHSVHELRADRSRRQNELNTLREKLRKQEKLISEHEGVISSANSTPAQRSESLDIIREAEREITRARDDISEIELDVDHLQKEESRLRSRLGI
jgi:hypothetical protein